MASLKMTPLAQMHLLLREHGWKPDYHPVIDWWEWTRAGSVTRIRTGKWMKTFWDEVEPDGFIAKHQKVAFLRKRLKELAQAQRLKPCAGC